MRSLGLFFVVAVLHFALSSVGLVLSIRAAFDAQASFWAAPGEATLAWFAGVLLSPLRYLQKLLPEGWRSDPGFPGYLEIATVSVIFGATAVALLHLWRALRRGRDARSTAG